MGNFWETHGSMEDQIQMVGLADVMLDICLPFFTVAFLSSIVGSLVEGGGMG